MTTIGSEFHLFPHAQLPEAALRHLGILLPRLSLQRIIHPPVLPDWIEGRFTGFGVLEDDDITSKIELYLKGFKDIAGLFGENALLGPMSRGMGNDEEESRIGIQSKIRGRGIHDPDAEHLALIEAGVFMEMARNLDREEMELDHGLERSNKMEDEFREILGITGGEGPGEADDTITPRLSREKTYVLYMLSKRIAFWSRLFLHAHPDGTPVLVTLLPEIIEEVLDPVRTRCEKAGKAFSVERFPLVSIPSLENLPTEDFLILVAGLKESGVLKAYWDSLDRLTQNPLDGTARGENGKAGGILREKIEALCSKSGALPAPAVGMTLIRPAFGDEDDFWESLDREAKTLWHGKKFAPPRAFLCLGNARQ